LQAFLAHIGAHPHIVLLSVFLVAFLESVAFIGTVVPAAIVMFTAGALIGAGALDLWITLGAATLGAIAGDGLSYELGRAHSHRIKNWGIVRRYADALARAQHFIQRHGGKSILLARFLAPVRATVPVVAGIACLPRVKFYVVNVASAVLWAAVHILPGVLFGASMRVAEAVTARLAVVLIIIAALLWFVVWLVRIGARFVLPELRSLRDRVLLWAAQRRSLPARMIIYFFDPNRAESQVLLLLALLLLGSAWTFFSILEDVVGRDELVRVDLAVFNFLQSLRTSAIDHIMVAISALGGVYVLLPLAIVVLAWLAVRRCWHTAGYWLAAVGSYEIFVQILKYTLARERPMNLYGHRAIEQFSFPSGHATSSMVVYGFLTFLLSRKQTANVRVAIMATAAILVALIGFSRVYLGAHWLSDVLAGFALGLAWVTLLAAVYTHYGIVEDVQPAKLMIVVAATLLISGSWYIRHHYSADLVMYKPQLEERILAVQQWITSGWRQLPLQRVEISGDVEEPFTLQWADSASGIARSVGSAGWQAAPEWSLQTALVWLIPEVPVKDLPVLPKFNQGSSSKLAFVYFDPRQPMARIVLRLWRSHFFVSDPAGGQALPIWYGAIYREEFRRPFHLLTVAVTVDAGLAPPALRWPANIQWLKRTYSESGVQRSVFLVSPLFMNAAGFATPTNHRAAAARQMPPATPGPTRLPVFPVRENPPQGSW
jgi:membrane protein DedA with SNARE-associated domain/membrane-associated phospholipid phosphatase